MSYYYPQSETELIANRAFIQKLSRLYARSVEEADEVAQEAWLAILRKPRASILSVRGWLHQTIRRQVNSLIRKRMRRADVEWLSFDDERSSSLLDLLVEQGGVELLHHRVSCLDRKYARVLHLRYFEGVNRAGIARELDLPVSTVATRLRRGLELLRSAYAVGS